VISAPGTYTLRSGSINPVAGRAVCLVSDLDGTMVGVGDDVGCCIACGCPGIEAGDALVFGGRGKGVAKHYQCVFTTGRR
jgi:hypothetical protein